MDAGNGEGCRWLALGGEGEGGQLGGGKGGLVSRSSLGVPVKRRPAFGFCFCFALVRLNLAGADSPTRRNAWKTVVWTPLSPGPGGQGEEAEPV